MSIYTKKPVSVEAHVFNGSTSSKNRIESWMRNGKYIDSDIDTRDICEFKIKTLEGDMNVAIGDYVIKGISGEFYPCKPDIFEKTYSIGSQDGSAVTFNSIAEFNDYKQNLIEERITTWKSSIPMGDRQLAVNGMIDRYVYEMKYRILIEVEGGYYLDFTINDHELAGKNFDKLVDDVVGYIAREISREILLDTSDDFKYALRNLVRK